MSRRDDPLSEMRRLHDHLRRRAPLSLDDGTADRLLDGSMGSDDAPPEYRGVAGVLSALGRPAAPASPLEESGAVASLAVHLAGEPAATPRRSIVSVRRRMAMLGSTGLIGVAGLTSGLAAAGALPGAAQGVAADMLAKVGVTVPGPDEHSGGHPDVRGRSDEIADDDVAPAGSGAEGSQGQGAEISELARTTSATGVDKGAAISDAASDGKSRAGEGGPTTSTTGPAAPTGGTGVADGASSGHSSTGTETADESSGGSSAEGGDNAEDGLAHRP